MRKETSERKEAYENLYKRLRCSWVFMAKFDYICYDSLQSLHCDENRTFNSDRLFCSKTSRKAYCKFGKPAVSNSNEVSLFFLYNFNAAATQAFNNFVSCPETCNGHARVAAHVAAGSMGTEAN